MKTYRITYKPLQAAKSEDVIEAASLKYEGGTAVFTRNGEIVAIVNVESTRSIIEVVK